MTADVQRVWRFVRVSLRDQDEVTARFAAVSDLNHAMEHAATLVRRTTERDDVSDVCLRDPNRCDDRERSAGNGRIHASGPDHLEAPSGEPGDADSYEHGSEQRDPCVSGDRVETA
jgi:hypothetical protein